MIDVKRPRLLDDDLKEAATLRAMSLALNLQTPGVSTATLVLGPDDPEPAMHAWIECYNLNGSVGVYRVTTKTTDYAKQTTLTLRHGIDALADAVLPAQEEYNGPPAALLTRLLDAQKTLVQGVKPWTLGTCEATDSIRVDINYTRLSELLSSIEELLEDYFFEYDQSTFPWTLNVRAKPTTPDSEIRMNRAVTTISRTLNDADMCNQLILSINSESTANSVTTTNTIVKTYNNTASQQRHRAVIQKTADIDTKDDLTADPVTTPEADAWAARFLRDHADPAVQLQITKRALKHATGDDWDETRLGHICRVPLPDYGATYNERAVAVSYPDALGQPDTVVLSFANQLPRFSSSIASLKRESNKQARAGRAAGRSAAKAKEVQNWSQVVRYHDAALDGTGVKTLYESGIDMTPSGGVKIWNLEEGIQALYAGIEVNRRAITLKVSNGDVATQLAVECGNVHITGSEGAANLVVDGYITATALDTRMANVDQLFTTTGYAGTIYATNVSATGTLSGQTGDFTNVYARNYYVTDAAGNTDYQLGNAVTAFGTPTASAGQISIPFYTSAHPSSSSTPAGTINFNIADTAYYQSHVGISAVSPASAWEWDADEGYSMTVTATAKDGTTKTCGVAPPIITLSANLGTAATTAVHCYGPSSGGNQHALATQYSLYLKADNNYCYITKSNATPDTSSSGNVLARIANPKPDGSGTITDVVQRQTATFDADEKEIYVYPTVRGTNISNAPFDAPKLPVTASVTITEGSWTDSATKKAITAKLNGTTAATLTVSAPSVDVSFANADSTSVSSYYTTWHAGHQYRVRLTRGGTTVWNRYIKVTT